MSHAFDPTLAALNSAIKELDDYQAMNKLSGKDLAQWEFTRELLRAAVVSALQLI